MSIIGVADPIRNKGPGAHKGILYMVNYSIL